MEEINEKINDPGSRKISINTSEIIKKFMSLKDREMFCMEMSKAHFIT